MSVRAAIEAYREQFDVVENIASVGRIAADVTALMFRLPVGGHIRQIFEDTVRQEVAAELLPVAHLSDEDRRQIEDIAWLAFDRRLSFHASIAPPAGFA